MPIIRFQLDVASVSTIGKCPQLVQKVGEMVAIVVVSFELANYGPLVLRRWKVAIIDNKKNRTHR